MCYCISFSNEKDNPRMQYDNSVFDCLTTYKCIFCVGSNWIKINIGTSWSGLSSLIDLTPLCGLREGLDVELITVGYPARGSLSTLCVRSLSNHCQAKHKGGEPDLEYWLIGTKTWKLFSDCFLTFMFGSLNGGWGSLSS